MVSRGLLDLMITRIPGLSPVEKAELCRKFDREEDFSLLSKRDIEGILKRPAGREFWTMDALRAGAEKDETRCRRLGIGMVSLAGGDYPPLLREIYDPPVLLFYRGSLPSGDQSLAAIVGTRRPSAAAALQAYKLGKEFGCFGVPVVSGLALGIDALAHRGNIEARAPAVAVLASGPDQVYPLSNQDLARRILSGGGALVSEYPPGTGVRKWNFPARNRIISGLARLVVIVEAPAASGALITASFALEQGRELLVARAGLSSAQGAGTARLAEEGAAVIGSAAEIMEKRGLTENSLLADREIQEGPLKDNSSGGAFLASSLARELNISL
ncbi:MAG: DNA-processing protein DprA [Treponema sp.]|jgi:DNA processing protein|nr:DNA-processing protein DprA [Treponema sp.]